MVDLLALRASVRERLPELALIQDRNLRDKVVEAWAPALAETNRSALPQARRQRLRMVITRYMTYFSTFGEETCGTSRFLH